MDEIDKCAKALADAESALHTKKAEWATQTAALTAAEQATIAHREQFERAVRDSQKKAATEAAREYGESLARQRVLTSAVARLKTETDTREQIAERAVNDLVDAWYRHWPDDPDARTLLANTLRHRKRH